jgi:hypothetical protein
MANTYQLIEAKNLTSDAASVTFSSIPATYTDLVLNISARATPASVIERINLQFNGDTASNYFYTLLRGNGTNASSANSVANDIIELNGTNGANTTSNTFSVNTIYIPSYTVSQNKSISTMSAVENNGSLGYQEIGAARWANNAAITSILIDVSGSFVTGSSFYLYGIKNS